ncbi:STAS/SEC14 domain-containing protein [Hymenobacter persicinus]|uniref:STAS/SEC14 domain-containing protein n=1 Tax=Hymenobacter persicinus TaxID=2025506 RepID=A0A4Q5LF35_9BACT|nr:STAS/SEC14 domain-containing protein [Hymenobacter persicinus]RYU83319.1 hypothetical protein EWM57_03265 [Hymenobacter persicinus]
MEELQALLDTAALSVFYDPLNHWLYVEWKGIHTEESAQSGGTQILRCLQQCPCDKVLSDNTQVTSNWEKAAQWVGEYYYEQLAQRGVQYVAWVYPAHWAVRNSMDTAMKFITRPQVVTFDDLASAYSWLQQIG